MPQWNELQVPQKHLVLEWIKEAIDSGMKKQITLKAYGAFVAVLNGKRENFDVSEIWQELPPSTREHFDHASDILLGIEEDIDELEELMENEADEVLEPAEVLESDDPGKDVFPVENINVSEERTK